MRYGTLAPLPTLSPEGERELNMQPLESIEPLGHAIAMLLPGIAARADEIEQTRHLPADIAQSMAQAGAFNILRP